MHGLVAYLMEGLLSTRDSSLKALISCFDPPSLSYFSSINHYLLPCAVSGVVSLNLFFFFINSSASSFICEDFTVYYKDWLAYSD